MAFIQSLAIICIGFVFPVRIIRIKMFGALHDERTLKKVCICIVLLIFSTALTEAADYSEDCKCALIAEKNSLPQTSGLADLTGIALQEIPRVRLVERIRVDSLLKECELNALLNPDSVGKRFDAGKLLGADYLLILRSVDTHAGTALNAVIAETVYGLRLSSASYAFGSADLPQLARKLKRQVEQTLSRYRKGVQVIISAPPFLSRDLHHEKDYLQTAYAVIVEKRALQCRNTAVVEIREARALVQEKELTDKGTAGKRPLPYYILGEFRHDCDSERCSLNMKLRCGKRDISCFEKENLSSTEAVEFILSSVKSFLMKITLITLPENQNDEVKEIFQLKEQFEQFHSLGFSNEAIPLGEACLLLAENKLQLETRKKLIVDCALVCKKYIPGTIPLKAQIEKARKMLNAHKRGIDHLEVIIRSPDSGVWWRTRWFDLFWTESRPLSLLMRPSLVKALKTDIRQLDRRRRSLILETVPKIYTERSGRLQKKEKPWASNIIVYRGLSSGFGKLTFNEGLEWSFKAIRVLLRESSLWWPLEDSGRFPFTQGFDEFKGAMKLKKKRDLFQNHLERIRGLPSPRSAVLAEYIRLYYKVIVARSKDPKLIDDINDLKAQGRKILKHGSFFSDLDDLKKKLLRRLEPGVPHRYLPAKQEESLRMMKIKYLDIACIDRKGACIADISRIQQKWGDFKGIIQHKADADIFWFTRALLEMKQQGKLYLIHDQPEQWQYIYPPVSDGSNIWFVVPGRLTEAKQRKYYDLHCLRGETHKLVSFPWGESLPQSSTLQIQPFKPGVLLIAGGFGRPHRGWIGKVLLTEKRIKIFFEATRIRDHTTTGYDPVQDVNIGFLPGRIRPLPGNKSGSRFLLERISLAGRLSTVVIDANEEKIFSSNVRISSHTPCRSLRALNEIWIDNVIYWGKGKKLYKMESPDSGRITLASFDFYMGQILPWQDTLLIAGADGTWIQTDRNGRKSGILAKGFHPQKREISISNHYGILGCDRKKGFFRIELPSGDKEGLE